MQTLLLGGQGVFLGAVKEKNRFQRFDLPEVEWKNIFRFFPVNVIILINSRLSVFFAGSLLSVLRRKTTKP